MRTAARLQQTRIGGISAHVPQLFGGMDARAGKSLLRGGAKIADRGN